MKLSFVDFVIFDKLTVAGATHLVIDPAASSALLMFTPILERKFPCLKKISVLEENFHALRKFPCFKKISTH